MTDKGFRGALVAAVFASLAACGGGSGGAAGGEEPPLQLDTTVYARSLVLGVAVPQSLTRRSAAPGSTPTLTSPVSGQELVAGTNHLIAEYAAQGLPGLRLACTSGRGESIATVNQINLGVLVVSAALLLDSNWQSVDTESAWASTVSLVGWENCGVKAEGAPSPSSRVVGRPDGGYEQDVYDGNPGTNFNTLRLSVSQGAARAMRSESGLATQDDPARPLLLTWRAWRSSQGSTVFVFRGEPRLGAPRGTKGFISVYVAS